MEQDRYTRITLRLPRELHVQLDEAANEMSRSTNAEIVARLQQALQPNRENELIDLVVKQMSQIQQLEAERDAAVIDRGELAGYLQRKLKTPDQRCTDAVQAAEALTNARRLQMEREAQASFQIRQVRAEALARGEKPPTLRMGSKGVTVKPSEA